MTCSTKRPSHTLTPSLREAWLSTCDVDGFQSKGPIAGPDSSSLRHTFMTETPGARAWLGEWADSWVGQLGDNRDQKSNGASLLTHHMLIRVTWDSGQGWKTHPALPFTGFVTISLCFLCWNMSQENPNHSNREQSQSHRHASCLSSCRWAAGQVWL